jgi:hypothetical protein
MVFRNALGPFLYTAGRHAYDHAVGKTAIFEPFIYKMHYFTKTGSGQT